MSLIPLDAREGFIWFNGEMIPWQDAKLHVLTHGLHYGSSVFEGTRAYNRKIFKLTEHTERLAQSAKLLGFDLPFSGDAINKASEAVIEKNNISDGYLRHVAWRGSEMMGISAQKNTIHIAIATWEWPAYFGAASKMAGLKLALSDWVRPAPNMAPIASKAAGLYMICTLAKHKAEAEGFNDALMLDYRGYIAEATGANIFFLMDDGKLHTPLADCFLNGITRQTVIGLAKKLGVEVVERHIKPEEMGKAKEAFLTGTAAEVMPIAQIGDFHLTPDKMCKTLIKAYDAEVLGNFSGKSNAA